MQKLVNHFELFPFLSLLEALKYVFIPDRETGALCAMKEAEIFLDDPKSAESIKQLEQVVHHLLVNTVFSLPVLIV